MGAVPVRSEIARPLRAGRRGRRLRRVAMLSIHTSPLDQPGTGDAGGLNVYVVELSRRLAQLGIDVEIFTRATRSGLAPVVELTDGVLVRHIAAGPLEGLSKEDLPGQLCAVAAGVLRAEAQHEPGWYDLIHSHYWLSGQVGWLAAERWGVPLVHSMHTMARVKNLTVAEGDRPEPLTREIGEQQVVEAADRLLANTGDEARQLVDLYSADPAAVTVVAPGVDLDVFRPGDRVAARRAVGLRDDALVLLFVGRVQPLKAPDVLVRAAARMVAADPALRGRLQVVIVGGPSGTGLERPEALAALARSLGVGDLVRFQPPVPREELARWYVAADLTVVPSHSESFGLVAVESQACGTPVVAAAVGGLTTAVAHEASGVLVQGHDPERWARVLGGLAGAPERLRAYSAAARAHALRFGWNATAGAVADVYAEALEAARTPQRLASGS
ncbi:D-inositol-3-phosphate glycosyltransferase [Motilibacter aurantiacus]|uniref:D-inositol-3-phosphate glycosyltransferase n=1 Tax=Motilibacter aurantiacus TaxID=2714955 RepID=UPI00140AC2BA|nr:D-inositol-3-phosphate glycosyltransferase [Motilibacter aurantiacus]